MRLISIPFAGGSQYSFVGFNKYANAMGIRMITPEYPGRGKRFGDPLLFDIHDLVEDMLRQVYSELVPPYAIFGHSMGTIVGYLLTKRIISLNLPPPLRLFFSGNHGAGTKDRDPPIHHLPRNEFLAKLQEMGGCPDEVLKQEHVINLFEPVIRADFKLVETYIHQEGRPINIPITVLLGKDDKATNRYPVTWHMETTGSVEVIEFEGDHFFILRHVARIMDIISKSVMNRVYQ